MDAHKRMKVFRYSDPEDSGVFSVERVGMKKRGFTLIELMLVLLIFGVFSGMVVTSMCTHYLHLALDGDTEVLAKTIQAAQRFSQSQHCVYRLSIESEQGQYYVNMSSSENQPFSPANGALSGITSLTRGISFREVRKTQRGTGADNLIHFYPDGRSDSAVIVLACGEEEERTIEISSLAGQPEIQ
jgi:type II secretion system protein H